MPINLFGFTISRNESEDKTLRNQSFVVPNPEDGATTLQGGGYFGTYVDLDATSKTESELINRYRETSMHPETSIAIDEVVTEAIAAVDDEKAVEINLDKVKLPDNIKKSITDEFNNILKKLDFNFKAHDIFRRWYVDGRLYYQKVIDVKQPRRGIVELRQIDPRKIKKVREVKKEKDPKTGVNLVKSVEEFFIYNEQGINYISAQVPVQSQNTGIKITKDSICFVSSGIVDYDKNVVLSYLHKAVKPVNQLKMMEDSLVIYRLARAPERRIFYIDVGNLPKIKAEQYLKDIMARYRNKIVYDSTTGEIRDDRKMMSMLEDFWLPRREGGRGTEITTLPGGENLGQIDDINYFLNKVYKSLNVPMSRLQQESGINFGRQAEITRDELKFAKFISILRKKFNVLFNDLLKTQLVLKGIIVETDWDGLEEVIQYRYAQDQYFEEMKDAENMRNRLDLLNMAQPYVGMYLSKEFVRKKILRLTDEEIEEIEDQNEEDPVVSPEEADQMAQMQQPQGQSNGQSQPINNNQSQYATR
jgi:hypothetical protein